jgi:hypothetical protein
MLAMENSSEQRSRRVNNCSHSVGSKRPSAGLNYLETNMRRHLEVTARHKELASRQQA